MRFATMFHWKNPGLWVLLLFAAAGLAEAQLPVLRAPQPRPGDVPPPRSALALPLYARVDVDRVIDGDTFVGTVHLPWGVDLPDSHVRAATYDSWELPGRRGRDAREDLIDLLDSGQVYIRHMGEDRDNFGRLLGRYVVVKGTEKIIVRDWMAARGHVKPERGNSQD